MEAAEPPHSEMSSRSHVTSGQSTNQSASGRNKSVITEAVRTVKGNSVMYHLFLAFFLLLHWIDLGSDIYMVWYFKTSGHNSYHYAAQVFLIISSLLALFWNMQLYDRAVIKSFGGVIFGPVSRNLYLAIFPQSEDRESLWRDSETEGVKEIRNFYYLFAALLEDWPQAIINVAFLASHDDFSLVAYSQIASSMAMGLIKFYYGCSNLLSDSDDEIFV